MVCGEVRVIKRASRQVTASLFYFYFVQENDVRDGRCMSTAKVWKAVSVCVREKSCVESRGSVGCYGCPRRWARKKEMTNKDLRVLDLCCGFLFFQTGEIPVCICT